MKIGTAKDFKKKLTFRIKKDEPLVFRILPPLGNLADKGVWAKYYAIEWGYKGSDGRMKPFVNPRVINRKTKMVEVESQAHLKREELKAAKDIIIAGIEAGTHTEEQKNKINELVRQFNLEKRFFLNVINPKGEIGLLKMSYKMKQALDASIKDMQKKGVDPRSVDNGRFFVFSKTNPTGALQDWLFTVTPLTESVVIDGATYQKEPVHVLDEAIINRLSEEAYELDSLYPTPTADEVKRIVLEGVTAIDEILGKKKEVKQDVAVKRVEQRAEAVAETPTTNITESNLNSLLAEASIPEEKKVGAPIEVKVAAEIIQEQPVAKAEPIQEQPKQSTDDFLKSIGAM